MRNYKNIIWRYYIFTFLHGFALFSGVLVPFFTEWGGINLFQVQLLQGWFMFWIFVLEVPTGAVADYFGRKHSLALGALVLTIAVLLYGSSPGFVIFLIGEFLLALSMALISGADKAFLYDTLRDADRAHESKKFFGRAHSVMLASIGIAAPVGSYLASIYGLNAPILLASIPYFLSVIVAWSLPEPKKHDEKSESKRYLEIAKTGFLYFYHHRSLRTLAINAIVVASAAYFVLWFYQPLLQSIGFPIVFFGFMQAGMIITEILVASNFTKLEKIFGGVNYLKFAAIATSFSFILVGVFPNIVTISLFIILAGGVGLTRLELILAHMQKFIPSEKRATVLSSVSMYRRFFLIFLNPAIGFMADKSLGVALFAVGLLPLVVFFLAPIKREMLD